ncbi:MAG: FecR family protein [Gammaproteobacteria bacterium]
MQSDPKEEDWPEAAEELSQLEGEAIEWIVRLTSGKATACERTKFERWRSQSPQHEAAAQAARQLWVGMGQALTGAQAAAAESSSRTRSRFAAVMSSKKHWLALAASVVLGLFLVFEGVHNWRHDYVAATGEQGRFALSDGTSITLNSNTALDVHFSGDERRVVLARGEVFFDVTHNPDRPFIVQAASGQVRVLGTAFSVRRDGSDVTVTVERGRVQVTSDGRSSVLIKDQRVRIRDGELNGAEPADPYTQLAWRRGRLIIEDQALGDVVRELNRYYPGLIMVTDNAVAQRRLNAVVDLKHIDQWLAALDESQPIDIQHLGPVVVVH